MGIDYLHKRYRERKAEIRKRLQEFRQMQEKTDEEIFAELAFCLLTPQSKAKSCWRAIEKLKETGLLYGGCAEEIRRWLAAVRFNENKSRYIVGARLLFSGDNGNIKIREKINAMPTFAMREWLVKNVKGFGYKEASHFLRNTGYFNVAILDRHILKNLAKYGGIEMPKSLTPKKYLEIEEKMKRFAERTGIPFAELDLLFWSEETGEVFK